MLSIHTTYQYQHMHIYTPASIDYYYHTPIKMLSSIFIASLTSYFYNLIKTKLLF